jgi:hypothetical protein
MAKRFQGNNKLELSWCQMGKWDRGWMEHWFYVKTTGQTITYDDRMEETVYPLASVMSEMSPLSRVTPGRRLPQRGRRGTGPLPRRVVIPEVDIWLRRR